MSEPASGGGPEVRHDAAQQRFVADVEGGEAELVYSRPSTGRVNLMHTGVPPASRGEGVGDALVRAAIDWARGEQLGVDVSCPYVQAWLRRHPDVELP